MPESLPAPSGSTGCDRHNREDCVDCYAEACGATARDERTAPLVECSAWRCDCWGTYMLEQPTRDECRHCGRRWKKVTLREVRS